MRLLAVSIVCVLPALAQVQCLGLHAGKSTRAQVERVLGPAVRNMNLGSWQISGYRPKTGIRAIEVSYEEASGVSELIQLDLQNPTARAAVVSTMGLTQEPTVSRVEPDGRFVESFGPVSFVALTYASADRESGVVAIRCFSLQRFLLFSELAISKAESPTILSELQSYEKAAAAGDGIGMFALGSTYEAVEDYGRAREWYLKAAAAGYGMAMYRLGLMYALALHVPQDYQQARQWYQKAAALGIAPAMFGLGSLYDYGEPQDYRQARQWYEQAAVHGEPVAMSRLAFLYENALGGPRDYVRAREWYRKAADGGVPNAKQALERLGK